MRKDRSTPQPGRRPMSGQLSTNNPQPARGPKASKLEAAKAGPARTTQINVSPIVVRDGVVSLSGYGVRVVVEADRQAEALLHVIAQRGVDEPHVHALDDDAAPLVDRRRHTERDRPDIVRNELRHGRFELPDNGFLGVLRRRALVAADDLPSPRDNAGEDFRAAEIHADRMRCVHVQRVP